MSDILQQLILNPKYNKQMDWGAYFPEWFIYELDFGAAIASGASASATLSIQADASFILYEMSGTLFNANTQSASFGDTQTLDVSVSIQDTGAGKNLMSAPVQFTQLFGQSGKNRYEMPVPRILQANSSLIVTLTNNSGASLTKAYMAFHGAKMLKRR